MWNHGRICVTCIRNGETHRCHNLEEAGEILEQSKQGRIGCNRIIGPQTGADCNHPECGQFCNHLPVHDHPERVDISILDADFDQAYLANEEDEQRDGGDDRNGENHDVIQNERVFERLDEQTSVVCGHAQKFLHALVGGYHLLARGDQRQDTE